MNPCTPWFAAYAAICSFYFASVASAERIDPVIVTATRTALTVDDTLASVTVLTRTDIERSQAKTVPELLRGIPGVDLISAGSFGKQTSVFLRGTNSSHTLVLIDGIHVGAATTGAAAWEFLPLSQIDRIEIVRGPRSSLYGSEAVGGVVQIFTRKATDPLRLSAEIGVGSYHTREVGGGLSAATASNWYNVYAHRLVTGGINARQPVSEFGVVLDEPDRDGYDNTSFSARVGQRLGTKADIELHALQAQGNNKFDSSGNNQDDFVQRAAGAKLRVRPMTRWESSFALGHSLDERDNFRADSSIARTRFETKRRLLSWQNDLGLAQDQLLTIGADYSEDLVASTTAFTRASRENTGVFSQYQGLFRGHTLTTSLRTDNNQQFGHHETGNIGWGYGVTEGARLVAAFGTAFKAPTFNDLYFPGFSNPNLKPEESKTVELGLKSYRTPTTWSVAAYRTEVDDLIALDNTFIPQNLKRARIDGVEVETQTSFAQWSVSLGLSALDPRDETTGKILPRRSKKSAKLDLDRRFVHSEFGVSLIAQGARFDDTANTVRVGGYGVINLRAQYEVSKNWRLRARLDNLLDKEYQTISTFNTLGRNVFIGLAYQPKGP